MNQEGISSPRVPTLNEKSSSILVPTPLPGQASQSIYRSTAPYKLRQNTSTNSRVGDGTQDMFQYNVARPSFIQVATQIQPNLQKSDTILSINPDILAVNNNNTPSFNEKKDLMKVDEASSPTLSNNSAVGFESAIQNRKKSAKHNNNPSIQRRAPFNQEQSNISLLPLPNQYRSSAFKQINPGLSPSPHQDIGYAGQVPSLIMTRSKASMMMKTSEFIPHASIEKNMSISGDNKGLLNYQQSSNLFSSRPKVTTFMKQESSSNSRRKM